MVQQGQLERKKVSFMKCAFDVRSYVHRCALTWFRWESCCDATRLSASGGQAWLITRLPSAIHYSVCSTKCTADTRCSTASTTTVAAAAAAEPGSSCDAAVRWLAAASLRNAVHKPGAVHAATGCKFPLSIFSLSSNVLPVKRFQFVFIEKILGSV